MSDFNEEMPLRKISVKILSKMRPIIKNKPKNFKSMR